MTFRTLLWHSLLLCAFTVIAPNTQLFFFIGCQLASIFTQLTRRICDPIRSENFFSCANYSLRQMYPRKYCIIYHDSFLISFLICMISYFCHFFLPSFFTVKKLFSGNCATSLQQLLSPSGCDAGLLYLHLIPTDIRVVRTTKIARVGGINRFSP